MKLIREKTPLEYELLRSFHADLDNCSALCESKFITSYVNGTLSRLL